MDATYFSLSHELSGSSLQPMQSKTVSVTYNPGVTGGDHSAYLTLKNDLLNDTIHFFSSDTSKVVYRVSLDECEHTTDWTSSNALSVHVEDHKQGGGCLQSSGAETNEFRKSFSTPVNNVATHENAYLKIWYYVSDISNFATNNQIEVGSGGTNDRDEYNWNLNGKLENGWNELMLKFSEAGKNGSPDIGAINWIRVYHGKTGPITTRIDGIQIIDSTVSDQASYIYEDPLRPVNGISIFPNPAAQVLNVKGEKGKYTYHIFDSKGNMHYRGVNIDQSQIQLAGLPAGTYVLRIEEETFRFVKR